MSEHRFVWKQRKSGSWAMFEGGTAILWVVPDKTYPGMWRVSDVDGNLSDMVNLSRAKDAAVLIATRNLDSKRGDKPASGPPVSLNDPPLSVPNPPRAG